MRIVFSKRSNWRVAISPRIGTALLIPVAFIIGCGRGPAPAESPEAAHIGKVGQLVTDFKVANSGNNPKNLDDLKNWAVKSSKCDDTDFVSTRDHEPYVIEPQALSRGGGAAPMRTGSMA